MENPDNEYIIIPVCIFLIAAGIQQYITTFFLSSHVLFTMCWPCDFFCWWCCNLLTSNQDLWLVRDKKYRDPCSTE